MDNQEKRKFRRIKKIIKMLCEEIRYHDYKYYVEDNPEISDHKFDRKLERLKKLESKYPDLVTPDSPTQWRELGGELSFPSESQLRDFIAGNIEMIQIKLGPYRFKHSLSLYVNEDGRNGVEYRTDVGRIDILAIDEEDCFVIFELKLDKGADRVVGQVSRYMGWVKENLTEGEEVLGIIVAKTIDGKLKYAASANPNIYLFEYGLNFWLNKI